METDIETALDRIEKDSLGNISVRRARKFRDGDGVERTMWHREAYASGEIATLAPAEIRAELAKHEAGQAAPVLEVTYARDDATAKAALDLARTEGRVKPAPTKIDIEAAEPALDQRKD